MLKSEPSRIEPVFSERLWGSKSLAPLFSGKINLPEPIGEAWLTGVDCQIATGPFAGKKLSQAWREMPADWAGARSNTAAAFPLLVKFIFPEEKLSIQVHPGDAYAAAHEQAAGGRGKTEMWHIVSAQPGAQLLAGLKPGVTREKFLRGLSDNSLEDLLEAHLVKAGDTFFIPAGTPHTIGPNMVVFEVQEYSDLTYRIYDYGRVDSHGKPRELHIQKALEVMNFNSDRDVRTTALTIKHETMGQSLADKGMSILVACRYFASVKWEISKPLQTLSDTDAFRLVIFLSGTGQIVWDTGNSEFGHGECWIIPANLGVYSVLPSQPVEYIETY